MNGFVPRGRHLFVYDIAATLAAIGIAFGLRFDLCGLLHLAPDSLDAHGGKVLPMP